MTSNTSHIYSNFKTASRTLDESDPLGYAKDLFHIPKHHGKPSIYFTGNSLGAMPKAARKAIAVELEDWEQYGVEGHFMGRNPWKDYHEDFSPLLADIVGAKPSECVAMGSLTNNLHLLLVSFYRPTKEKYKIICERDAFPSDLYALESQIKFHGLDPKEALVKLAPREGEFHLRTEDILSTIDLHAEDACLVMIGGVNYYTGQWLDMKRITEHAKEKSLMVGWDLAHAAGNVPLSLHEWGVDFAAWCSYKYLNSGPGSVAGIFIHERHHDKELPRFHGWWGHSKEERFQMEDTFVPIPTAEAWQLSNAPVLAMAVHREALKIHQNIGMEALRKKSLLLSKHTLDGVALINETWGEGTLQVITPSDEKDRGSQISLFVGNYGKAFFDLLSDQGVISDWREPNVIRIAPVPLYNTYQDIYHFILALHTTLEKITA